MHTKTDILLNAARAAALAACNAELSKLATMIQNRQLVGFSHSDLDDLRGEWLEARREVLQKLGGVAFEDRTNYGRSALRELEEYFAQQGAREVGETRTGQAWQIGGDYFTIISEEINRGFGRRYELQPITRDDVRFWFHEVTE